VDDPQWLGQRTSSGGGGTVCAPPRRDYVGPPAGVGLPSGARREGRNGVKLAAEPRTGAASRGEATMARKEHWKDEPEEQDYPAALSYLSFVTTEDRAEALVAALRKAPIIGRMAKDLLRASRLEVLPIDNFHVQKDLKKVDKGRRLSPVLLVVGDLATDTPLTIADGYHRICASYHLDEDAVIPCRLVDVDAGHGSSVHSR
jgi:hypothetical protein